MQAEQEEPEVSTPEAQWTQCRKLWSEAFRVYLADCKAVWLRPEGKHEPEALEALSDMLSPTMPQLNFICDHLGSDVNAPYVKMIFLRWIRKQQPPAVNPAD